MTLPEWAQRGRAQWKYTGDERPPWADEPGPGEESVWDYPRPPVLVEEPREVVVRVGATLIAQTRNAKRLLETGSPPTFYVDPADILVATQPSTEGSLCEFKGKASYWTIAGVENGAWSYERPFEEYLTLAGWIAFYPSKFECFVDGERVRPQANPYHGGWVTDAIVGPGKGGGPL